MHWTKSEREREREQRRNGMLLFFLSTDNRTTTTHPLTQLLASINEQRLFLFPPPVASCLVHPLDFSPLATDHPSVQFFARLINLLGIAELNIDPIHTEKENDIVLQQFLASLAFLFLLHEIEIKYIRLIDRCVQMSCLLHSEISLRNRTSLLYRSHELSLLREVRVERAVQWTTEIIVFVCFLEWTMFESLSTFNLSLVSQRFFNRSTHANTLIRIKTD